MRGRGIEPTEHIYRALIWCCGRHHRAGTWAALLLLPRGGAGQGGAAVCVRRVGFGVGVAGRHEGWQCALPGGLPLVPLLSCPPPHTTPTYVPADRAQGVFDEMRARGLEPSVPTWSALLNAYADSRQPHRAVEALQGMRRQGLTPSVQVYGALAKAFAGSGDWRRALQVIERMEGDGVAPNEQVPGGVGRGRMGRRGWMGTWST